MTNVYKTSEDAAELTAPCLPTSNARGVVLPVWSRRGQAKGMIPMGTRLVPPVVAVRFPSVFRQSKNSVLIARIGEVRGEINHGRNRPNSVRTGRARDPELMDGIGRGERSSRCKVRGSGNTTSEIPETCASRSAHRPPWEAGRQNMGPCWIAVLGLMLRNSANGLLPA